MTNEEAVEILKGAIKKPNTKDGYLGQALDMAIKALEQQRWIPVTERLPKKCDYYLITTKIEIHDLKPYYEVYIAKFDGKYFDIGYIGDDINVVAWKPRPESYKTESEDQ